MKIIQKPIKHFNDRKEKIEFLVIHCMAFNADEGYKIFDEYELSVHYIIENNGKIFQLINEKKRAYHAGIGCWNGINTDLNSRSIGIELESKSLGQTEYSKEQLASLMELSKDIIKRHNIKPYNIVAHSDITPTRKPDPGMCFPWQDFAINEVGLWFDINNAEKFEENDVAKLLSIIGYNVEDKETLIASAYAFRRRFLPEEIDTIDDIFELLNNCYPVGKTELLEGNKFLKTLKAVAFEFQQARK
jgi:N-acetylmuramoyl-L-alanine amidase